MPHRDSSADPAPPELLTTPQLRRRGWSAAMIRDLLSPPDQVRSNPRWPSGAPMPVYAAHRVRRIETQDAFARRARLAAQRSAAARKLAERKREHTLEHVRGLPIRLPLLEPAVLAERALAHRDAHQQLHALRRDALPDPATTEQAPAASHRWQVNYLRHALTPYDQVLAGLRGRVGRLPAEILLRRRVYAAIAARYPHLAAECDRQLSEGLSLTPPDPR